MLHFVFVPRFTFENFTLSHFTHFTPSDEIATFRHNVIIYVDLTLCYKNNASFLDFSYQFLARHAVEVS